MATFNKFNAFVADVANGVHNLDTDTLRVILTNTLPTASNSVLADITQIAAGNGYSTNGQALTVTSSSQTGGVYRLIISPDVTFTGSGGTMATFRYVVFYNSTPAGGPLIGWYDYGAAVSLNNGEPFDIDMNQVNGLLTLA